MTTVIYHDADFDGLFCREIAKKFLSAVANFIGWDFGKPKIKWPREGTVYVLDLPPDCLELPDINEIRRRMVWIDHHKSSIEKWSIGIPGYRIDGVAACRLTWQCFTTFSHPIKDQFINREVKEPYAVTLAGEYDIWDHEASSGKDIAFQFGLQSVERLDWELLLSIDKYYSSFEYVNSLIERGVACHIYANNQAADIAVKRGFDLDWEGLYFRSINTARSNSLFFHAALRPEHDACLSYYWNGKTYIVSLYGVPSKSDLDLSLIAKKYGGGGHKQACGFQAAKLPWEKL